MLKVTINVEHEQGVIAEASFWVRDDLYDVRGLSKREAGFSAANSQLVNGFWGAYQTVTQPPADPSQTS